MKRKTIRSKGRKSKNEEKWKEMKGEGEMKKEVNKNKQSCSMRRTGDNKNVIALLTSHMKADTATQRILQRMLTESCLC